MKTKPANPNSHDLINKVVNFYKQYLDCSPEQLDLLALWTMHTHIIPAAPFSPSLNICSREKHSGKTVCLQLLSLLCDGPSMHTAAAPSLLIHQLTDDDEPFSGTLLLDDCDATFGKTRMNIKLQGLFTARFQQDARFTVRIKDDGEYICDDRLVFFPAAFAGNGRLHPALAERSILISVEPKKAGSACQPFRFYAAQSQARSLHFDLSDWGNVNHERFEKIAPYKEDQFPPELSWRNRDCAEPLLHVADFIGGNWPQRARQALVNAFALAAFEDFYSSKQILSDIRDAFFEKGNPEWISTTDVLEFLHTMDNRIWDSWTKDKPMQPKAMARLLDPFGIAPRNHRTGPKTVPKGYHREDLEPLWQRHLPGLKPPAVPVAANLQNSFPGNPKPAASSVAANLQNPVPVAPKSTNPVQTQPKPAASSQKPVAGVPVAAKMQNLPPSKPATSNQPKGVVPRPVAAVLQNSPPKDPKPAAVLRCPPKEASSQKLVAPPVAANFQNPTHPPTPNLFGRRQKPTIGERILALPRQVAGGIQETSFTREAMIGGDTDIFKR